MTYNDKDYGKDSFKFKKSRSNNVHTLFYYNISECDGNLKVMLDEGTHKTTIHNIHKLGWKAQSFKSADV